MTDEPDDSPAPHRAHAPDHAEAWIRRFAPLVRRDATLLDVAAGHGRHARYFAARGAKVLAVDRDAGALAMLDGVEGVTTRVADLEGDPWRFERGSFDAIVVVNYLHRALLPRIVDTLASGGVLLYETFAAGNERYGRPVRADFLLREDELLEFAQPRLRVVAFEQGLLDDGRLRVVQRIAAVGRTHPWPAPLPGDGG